MKKMLELNNDLRPRERLKKYGVKALKDDELLAIILRCGTKDTNVLELANILINEFNCLYNFNDITLLELAKIKGIGEVKAGIILAAIEFGKRVIKKNSLSLKIYNSYNIYSYFKYDFIGIKQEHLVIILLDNSNTIIKYKTLFIGTLNASLVQPREVFKEAITNSAAKIILLHNHPSGDSTPSKKDIEFTNSIKELSLILGIPLIDHIIIGYNNYYSIIDNKRYNDEENI